MIPKRIFYVWGANDPKKRDVLACMQSWRQNCPGYEIIEINENSTDYFNFQQELENNVWFRTVYNRQMWAYVADYIRVKVLYKNGGIYLDTDVTVVKNFDQFLENPAFVGIQDCAIDGHNDLVEPAILGAEQGNEFLADMCRFYDDDIWKEPIFTMPEIFKHFLAKKDCPKFKLKDEQEIIKLDNIYIYPERYFIPFRFQETFTPDCVENDTHTIHWFGSSWVKPEILHFLRNKHSKTEIAPQEVVLNQSSCFRLFGLIPLLKITEKTKGNKELRLFNRINLMSWQFDDSITRVRLLKFVNLFQMKQRPKKTKLYLFGVIPVYVIKRDFNA